MEKLKITNNKLNSDLEIINAIFNISEKNKSALFCFN